MQKQFRHLLIFSNKWHFEEEARFAGYQIVAGVDEAGRGPLAGPLVVAACILLNGFFLPEINDSKKLSPRQREEVYQVLVSDPKVIFAVEIVSVEKIDQINILQATMYGMVQSVQHLSVRPDFVLVDGNRAPDFSFLSKIIPSRAVVNGDALSFTIGAASILAKVTRDKIVDQYEEQWPEYGFSKHKGYPTKMHREVLSKLGATEVHRRSYKPVQEALLKK